MWDKYSLLFIANSSCGSAQSNCVPRFYLLTRKFPREEIYGLTNQLRRASVSIPSNIAEGYGRGSTEQYKYFLSVAQGSYLELQTQLLIASRLGFADQAEVSEVASLASEVGKMLGAILRKLQER
jgi:four helix bundle protein